MRAGRGFGVVLDAEDRQPLVAHAFEGLVVEVDVAGLDVGGKRGGIDGEAVVLGGDLDLARSLVADRLVGAAVAELELERLAAEGLAQELVAQADAEDRDTARLGGRPDQGLERLIGFEQRAGSPGPLERKMPSGWCSRIASAGMRAGHDRHAAADLDQVPRDVPLHAEIERHDVRAGVRAGLGSRAGRRLRGARSSSNSRFSPGSQVTLAGHDLARQVAADQAGALPAPWPPGWRRRGRSSRGCPSSPLARASAGPAPGCRSPRCR